MMLVVMMIEDMLAILMHVGDPAATVDRALALIDAQVFDVAVLDMNLSGNDNRRCRRRFRRAEYPSSTRPATPVTV
jgi:CheY-like chemotaxis protein